jgi:lactoylglutathione lyase
MACCAAQQKAARALHRTAPDTTADCAVPPLHHQSTKPEMVAPVCNIIRGQRWRGDGYGKTLPLKSIALRLLTVAKNVAARDASKAKERPIMPTVTWDHVHLRSPDPEATAAWLADVLGGEIIRGPGRIDVKLGGANVFIAPVTAGDGVHTPPVTPYQGLDHFGLTVKDIDAVAAEIRAKGVEFTKEPTTIRPGVRICFIRGPQGISVELLERDKKYA